MRLSPGLIDPTCGERQLLKGCSFAFTLLEVLVATVVMGTVILVLASVLNQTAQTGNYAKERMDQFRQARNAFEAIGRNLSQAVLNPYWDYVDASGSPRTSANAKSFVPAHYRRQSELRFRSGLGLAGGSAANPTHAVFFQAPLGVVDDISAFGGLSELLNTVGYYIEYGSDEELRPDFLNGVTNAPAPRYRFRLMEMTEPAEKLSLFRHTARNISYGGSSWFSDPLGNSPIPAHVIAENIIALIVLPALSPEEDPSGNTLAPDYSFDSSNAGDRTHELPPVVQLTMVAVDEASFARLNPGIQPPALVPSGLFRNAASYDQDMKILMNALDEKKIGYRILSTSVPIRGARWNEVRN